METMNDGKKLRIATIGSYVPRRCGIATFTHDLMTAISRHVYDEPMSDEGSVSVIAMNDREESYDYGGEVKLEIPQHRRSEYRAAADAINNGRVDVVSLQHEYGLFGGECGEYLLDLVQRLRKPLITTLHTVLLDPSQKQREVLNAICDQSSSVVVMAEKARSILADVNGVTGDKVRLIPHGVPDVPFGDTEPYKARFDLAGRPVILTFGLLSPGKGIEVSLDALAAVVKKHPNVAYIVLGVTHPGVRRESGEQYRISLESQCVRLGIQKNVLFHNHYVSSADLHDYLLAADLYVTPYRAREQITSGTLAYAVACGKAVVSTPYWYAEELLADGRGRMFEFGDSDALAEHLSELLSDRDVRERMREQAYRFGRRMVWPQVARQYVECFATSQHGYAAQEKVGAPRATLLTHLSLPEPRLDHMVRMTDDTGMLQHAVYVMPDRRHGYCTDDNARALIVTAMTWSLFQDETAIPYLHRYLAFLHFAFRPDINRFRNFMSYDRKWLEEQGSDDSQGRAMWSLGYLVAHAPQESDRRLAAGLFRRALPLVNSLDWPRSWAFAILGLHYYLREFKDDEEVRSRLDALADRLATRFDRNPSSDWPWFEDVVTYDNARIPQALIIAGVSLQRQELLDRGVEVLGWLSKVQTAQEGHMSFIGNDGWLRKNDRRARFDQQPLEAAAFIGACKAAYRATQDSQWLLEMRRCFEWYLGRNDGKVSLVDFKSRGCRDGLSRDGVNENQGAESTLSWLLALLIMHEMQTGDPPDVG